MKAVVPADQMRLALKFREILATYHEAEDLINIGAYRAGANPKIDLAISKIDEMNLFLKQKGNETCSLAEAHRQMQALFMDTV
jgi:flagellum-specific ATP synthase